jgi:nucleoid-associated protein YgaU
MLMDPSQGPYAALPPRHKQLAIPSAMGLISMHGALLGLLTACAGLRLGAHADTTLRGAGKPHIHHTQNHAVPTYQLAFFASRKIVPHAGAPHARAFDRHT